MKRKFFDIYHDTEIKFLTKENCEDWLLEELKNLYRDFSQKYEVDQIKYEANRLKEFVLAPKYRNWTCAEIHFALQGMLSENISYKKVTIKSIQNALDYAFRIRQEQQRRQKFSSENDDKNIENKSHEEAERWLPYIKFWMNHEINPKIVTLQVYEEAKKNGQTEDLITNWGGSLLTGPLFSTKNHRK